MENISHQGFGEWVCKNVSGLYLPHLHNIFGNMLPKEIEEKGHIFLVHIATRISRVKHHTHVVHKYKCRFGYLDNYWSKVVPYHNILLDSLLQRCELRTKCWGLHHVLVFWWPCCGCLYYHWKKTSDWSISDLVVPMVSIQKHMNVQLIN